MTKRSTGRADFSMGDALGAGFRLFRRQPAAVLGWGALHMLLAVGAWFVLVPLLRDISFMTLGSAAEVERINAMVGFQAAIWALNLAQLAITLVVWTAAMRATLKPGRSDPFLFLRAGMDEVRVGVMAVALIAGFYAFILLVALLGVALGFALSATGETAAVIGVFVYVLLVLAVILVGWSRLSLLMPTSMITGGFAFEEGWRIGKGRTAKLVGLNLLLLLIYYVAAILFVGLLGAGLVGVFLATGGVWPTDPQTLDDIFQALRPMAPWAALAMLVMIPFSGWLIAFWAGALTTAARQLADGALPPERARDAAEPSR